MKQIEWPGLCGQNEEFLGAFAKLPKAIISFFVYICPSVTVRMEQLDSHWKDFNKI
jgi:hypothetical protein